ncbi:oxidoreductase [Bradyrhizobium pachyrhizi]|uniref:oxidoreductase n=1 Tax=Bradyrhizobium pachyrhizi TaxID=280333 RepID=UPI003D36B76C
MRVWFITGASRGFGALIAEAALKAGDAVVATARDPATVTARLGQHERLLATRLDVTSEAEAHAAAGEAVKKFGRIDILINNAGYGLLGAIEEASAAETQRLFGTNVFGLLGVTRAVLPHMRRQRSGHVINISSVGGYTGYPGWGVYGATKFAVEGISEALAAEVAPLGIKVTVVEPGFFRTDFLDESSLSRTAHQIEDYHASVGKTRAVAADFNHGQRGDPRKLAGAMLKLVNADNPPLRLPLGSDTVERIETKNAFVARELAEWRTVATSTDFTEEA